MTANFLLLFLISISLIINAYGLFLNYFSQIDFYMKTRLNYLILLNLCVFLTGIYPERIFAQEDQSAKDMYVEAESYFLFEEYADALPLYQRLLRNDPENANLNYKIGICYLNNEYQKEKSIKYLLKAINNITNDYKTNSYKEKKAPREAYYYLGDAYRINNDLDKALDAFEHFKQILDPAVYDVELVNKQIKSCNLAKDLESRPIYFTAKNLGQTINTRFADVRPVISGDEKSLVFTTKLQFYDAVFISTRPDTNSDWSPPLNLTPSFGVDGNTYSTGISYHGDEIYVYRSDEFDGNIYVSKLVNKQWTKLVKLNDNINTKYWESHASVSPDGKTLYFTSNRKGGYGGLDIYKSERSGKDNWGPAVNLGPVINTKYNEETPFITDDGKTLYFSSFGHYNMGGYDIFYSTLLDNGKWSVPVNVGYPLNTTDDDLFFVPVKNGAYAYYSMYKPGDSYGLNDIYRLEVFSDIHPRKFIIEGITRIQGTIPDGFKGVEARLYKKNTNKLVDQTSLNSDGSFSLNATQGDFDLRIEGNGIEPVSQTLNIPVNNPSGTVSTSELLLTPFTGGQKEASTLTQEKQPAELPELKVNKLYIEVNTDESLPIKLTVKPHSQLKVETFNNDESVSVDSFMIERKRFVYGFKPMEGKNIVRFTVTDSDGNTNTKEVTVIYKPVPQKATEPLTVKIDSVYNSKLIASLADMSSGSLREFLDSLGTGGLTFDSAAELYDYLMKQAGSHKFTQGEVDRLFIKMLSKKDLRSFYSEIVKYGGDSIRKVLSGIDLQKENIRTSGELIRYMKSIAVTPEQKDELLSTIIKIISGSGDTDYFLRTLKNQSGGTMRDTLQVLLQMKRFDHPADAAHYLLNTFDQDSVWQLLTNTATLIDLKTLYFNSLFVATGPIRLALLEIDFDRDKINTSEDLLNYLMGNAEKYGYSKKELIQLMEEARTNNVKNIESFTAMLADHAKGNLKSFLQNLDTKSAGISSYDELFNYIIRKSAHNDLNRENFYQLFIDIIGARNTEEFIQLLSKYATGDLKKVIQGLDKYRYSTPIEIIQYLVSHAGEFNYSEQDINDVLLRLIMEKGINLNKVGYAFKEKARFFSHGNRMAITLVIANVIFLIILILLISRRKKKEPKS